MGDASGLDEPLAVVLGNRAASAIAHVARPPQKSVEKILCRGWKKIGISGTKPKCLSWIDANWTDTDDRTEREKRREKSGVEPYYKVRRCRPTGTPAAPLRVAHSPLRPLTLFRTTSTRTPSHANV